MQVPAKIFLTEELHQLTEEEMWTQVVNACSFPGVKEVAITPDSHFGYGVPIGCVMSSETHLYPTAAGYDINCGMSLIETNLTVEDFVSRESRRKFIKEVEDRVPTGMGVHRMAKQKKISDANTQDLLRRGALVIEYRDKDYHERTHLPIEQEIPFPPRVSEKLGQLGSLGGGNHFIELQANKEGKIFVMLHTGSRGFGWNIANYFFKEGARLQGCNADMVAFPHDSEMGKAYWNLHNMAGNFAICNRILIMDAIIEALNEVKPCDAKPLYEISHNLVQKEFGNFVHRKGATRAFPGSLMKPKSAWAEKGHPIIIPGSMAAGAAVLYAQEGAQESLYSINHGAGRLLGRNQAKKRLNQKDVNDWMENVVQTFNGVEVKGILVNGRNVPLDESGGCYKDLDVILNAVETAGLATVTERLFPIAVIKGEE